MYALLTAPALRVSLATLRAATSNYRLYVGVWMIAVIAPLAGVSYHFFDRTVFDPAEYYGNAYYLLFAISPHVSLLISLTGVFFLFPKFSRAKFFLVVPSSYHLAKIIHLWQVTSNAEYHEVLPREFFLLGLTLTIVWFCTADYLMGLQFHKQDGIMARIEGILNSPGIDDHTKVEIARGQVADLKSLKSQS